MHARVDLGTVVVGLAFVVAGGQIQYMVLASTIVLAIVLVSDEDGRLGGLACLVLYSPSFLV